MAGQGEKCRGLLAEDWSPRIANGFQVPLAPAMSYLSSLCRQASLTGQARMTKYGHSGSQRVVLQIKLHPDLE